MPSRESKIKVSFTSCRFSSKVSRVIASLLETLKPQSQPKQHGRLFLQNSCRCRLHLRSFLSRVSSNNMKKNFTTEVTEYTEKPNFLKPSLTSVSSGVKSFNFLWILILTS